MELNKFIEENFFDVISNYEHKKNLKSRFYNTLIQCCNIVKSCDQNQKLLEYYMIKAVEKFTSSLENENQRKKFLKDNKPISFEDLEIMLSEVYLIDTCSAIEFALFDFCWLVICLQDKDDFNSSDSESFKKHCKEKSKKKFSKKYDAIDYMYSYVNADDILNKVNELNKSKEILKHIFFIRNCLVHNDGIFQDYAFNHQESIKNELNSMEIKTFEKDKKIVLDIDEINKMTLKLRETSEVLILYICEKIKEYLSDEGKNKLNNYYSTIFIN